MRRLMQVKTIRAAILSVNPGEIEAARSLGGDTSASLSSRDYSECGGSCDTDFD